MKRILFFMLLVSCFGYGQVGNYNVGDVVDDFTVTDTKGVQHNLYEITASGKYVVLDFFFTTCPPCQQTQRYFNELYDKYGCNDGDIYTLSITGYPGDNNAKVDLFEETYGGPFNHSPAISLDGNGAAVVSNFGIGAYPTYCIVGPDNKLVVDDIWPVSNVTTFENAFPNDFDPTPMECTVMAVSDMDKLAVNIYPTVSDGKLTISLPKEDNVSVKVYNMAGQEVYSNQYKSTNNINLDMKLSAGLYFVKVTTASDNTSSMKKIIIK